MQTAGKRQAIGYIRYSSDEQHDGHSVERQTAGIRTYCQRNAFELVEFVIDDGYSAYKGEHLSRGNLGRFLQPRSLNSFRGFAFVLEAMDRLSRQGIGETFRLAGILLEAGCEIHLTQDGRVIRTLDDLPTVIMSALDAHGAKEYSQRLRDRVSAAWGKKKHESPPGICITARLPAWLKGKNGEPITVIEERAAVVRHIFTMVADGMGKRLVARELNAKKVPTFGHARKWQYSYICKLLYNRAVLGDYQPFKRQGDDRVPDGEVRQGYYPAIIEPVLWEKAHESLRERTVIYNGKVTGTGQGRTGKAHNLFSGIVFDATGPVPRSMYWQNKGTSARPGRSRPKLTTGAIDGEDPRVFPYEPFEQGFLHFLDQLDWREVLDVTEAEELQQADAEAARLKLELERILAQGERVAELLIDTPSKTLKERLLKLEQESEALRESVQTADVRATGLRRKHRDLLDDSIVYEQLASVKDFETRVRLRSEIRRRVARIEFVAFDVEYSEGDLQEEFKAIVRVLFVNGAMRMMGFTADERVILVNLDFRTA